ncbi:MAG: extracellular solute-binding protein [Proteobacteria bacterium]|nr:extracellular solute-binding protein [Pseudomonadota bacterium]
MSRLKSTLWGSMLAVVAAVGLIVANPAAAQSEANLYEKAKSEKDLSLYTDMQIVVVQALIDGFKAKYPGVDVDYFRAGSGPVTQRFETESAAGRHQADIVTLTDRQSKLLAAKGLTAPYRSRHLDKYPAELHAPNNAWNTYGTVQLGIAWNTDLVKDADAPKSFQALLEPKWKGKLGMQDPLQGGGAGIWVATMYGLWGEQEWTSFMSKLGAQKLRYAGYLEVRDMLAGGEIEVQLVAYPAFTQPVIDKGAPIKWALIDPALFTGLTLNLSKNAPHPNAAKLFIDYVVSEEGQGILAANSQVPALPQALPDIYKSISSVKLVPQAHELESEKADYFRAKIQEYLVR